MKTFWNGKPCKAKRVKVIVGEAPATWWCAKLVGQEHWAVRIRQGKSEFYLNDDEDTWRKITEGKGSFSYPHKSLPVEREVKLPFLCRLNRHFWVGIAMPFGGKLTPLGTIFCERCGETRELKPGEGPK